MIAVAKAFEDESGAVAYMVDLLALHAIESPSDSVSLSLDVIGSNATFTILLGAFGATCLALELDGTNEEAWVMVTGGVGLGVSFLGNHFGDGLLFSGAWHCCWLSLIAFSSCVMTAMESATCF